MDIRRRHRRTVDNLWNRRGCSWLEREAAVGPHTLTAKKYLTTSAHHPSDNMATETITVRMSRSDPSIIWGFRLQGGKDFHTPLTISKVVPGSLAERAGLVEGDYVVQIGGVAVDQMQHRDAQDAIVSSANDVELVIERTGCKIWKPTIRSAADQFSPVKYSLAHHDDMLQDDSLADSGFRSFSSGVGTPGDSRPTYGSQMDSSFASSGRRTDYSYQSPQKPLKSADSYLRETGGLFGTDPNLQKTQQPSFLHSETLRLIREREGQETEHGRGHHPSVEPIKEGSRGMNFAEGQRMARTPGAPECYSCGRQIFGVFCKVSDNCYHSDCFKCSTCGTSLKNVGHYLLNGKLYCDIHARQQQQDLFRATGPQDPSIFSFRGAPPQPSPKHNEPPKAFYQPDVLKPASSPIPHVHSAPLSPSSRGIPTHQVSKMPGSCLRGISQEMETNRPPPPPAPYTSTGGSQLYQEAHSVNGRTVGSYMPRRGRGILKQIGEGSRIPVCEACMREIRGPFVLALSKTWCPDHFTCSHPDCQRKLLDVGFVEEAGFIYCEFCFEKYLAPTCNKCQRPIVGDTLTAMERKWHPQCFCCAHCHQPFGNSCFFLEEGKPFCEKDWNALFTTKCSTCQFPIEAGDRWVEALGNAYHSNCFNCTICQRSLEGQNFYLKGGHPYCKAHA
uniref:PDZ and LIM domain protein Zasp n=1 Tax=Trichuris muris TaxID=70415 RepID=A0A5S6R0R6_TRIMR